MLTIVIAIIANILTRFKKLAFFAPILSITHPITCDPTISPTPKQAIARSPLEVSEALLKFLSSSVSFSSRMIAGIKRLDQKEIDTPVHRIYRSKKSILGLTSMRRVLVNSSVIVLCCCAKPARLDLTSSS